jgi:hypothetical protein
MQTLPEQLNRYGVVEFFWFATDAYGHAVGEAAHAQSLARFDAALGAVWPRLEDANLNVIVYGDHGLTFTDETVDLHAIFGERLPGQLRHWCYPNIYLNAPEEAPSLAYALSRPGGIDYVFYRVDPRPGRGVRRRRLRRIRGRRRRHPLPLGGRPAGVRRPRLRRRGAHAGSVAGPHDRRPLPGGAGQPVPLPAAPGRRRPGRRAQPAAHPAHDARQPGEPRRVHRHRPGGARPRPRARRRAVGRARPAVAPHPVPRPAGADLRGGSRTGTPRLRGVVAARRPDRGRPAAGLARRSLARGRGRGARETGGVDGGRRLLHLPHPLLGRRRGPRSATAASSRWRASSWSSTSMRRASTSRPGSTARGGRWAGASACA